MNFKHSFILTNFISPEIYWDRLKTKTQDEFTGLVTNTLFNDVLFTPFSLLVLPIEPLVTNENDRPQVCCSLVIGISVLKGKLCTHSINLITVTLDLGLNDAFHRLSTRYLWGIYNGAITYVLTAAIS